ncbi:hypothetical protein [Geminisphaera colitermitum]|uniref:hypothetical protein n=1 Tax=Geminisphaera colitermitum TaxID=1148786 RepID=UPI000158C728|nr:hypothetical protein [Geminisphaera colitermitum]
MIEWIKNYQFNGLLAIYTYWIPLTVCSATYICRIIDKYRIDVKASTKPFYRPELTVGFIVWHIIIATLPAINLFALVFDCASSVFRWLGKVLNVPLVRARPSNTHANTAP